MRIFPVIASLLLCCRVVPANPVIAEFMAANATTLKDGHDNYEDWIEIWNPGATDTGFLTRLAPLGIRAIR